MVRLVLSCLFVALLAAAGTWFVTIGHCFPALAVALVAGAALAAINPLGGRQRAPRLLAAIIFIGGFWISHRFAGVPDRGPHRLAYDAQYLAVLLGAALLTRAVRSRAA